MATQTLERPTMTKRNDQPAKIDVEVLRKARIAASYKGMSLAEYLSEALRPIVIRDIEEGHAREIQVAKEGAASPAIAPKRRGKKKD